MQEYKASKIKKVSAKKSGNGKTVTNAVERRPDARVTRKSDRRMANMHAVRSVRIENIKKKDKAPFPWAIVLTAVIFTAMFLFMMMNYAEVDKYNSELTELNSQLNTMKKTQSELEVQLSNKYNLDEIKDYAESELGMVKKETLRKTYIVIEQDDKAEMTTYDDGEEGGFGYLLAGLGEVITDFFE